MKVSQSIFLQLQHVDYNEAIKRYTDLRTWFLNEFSVAAKLEGEAAADTIEKTIATEINNTSLESIVPQTTKQLYEDVAAILKARIENNKDAKSQIKQIKKDYKQSGEKVKKKAEQQATLLGESLLSDEELKEIIATSLSRLQVGSSFSADDILTQLKGYRLRYLTRSKAKKRVINITKGYYQEALIYKAFSTLIDTLDINLTVLDTGGIKVDGKDTLYDTYLRFFNNLDKCQFSKIVSENLDIGYGLQSKSWKIPLQSNSSEWSVLKNKYGFGLGSRDQLLSMSGLKGEPFHENTWLRGVQFLEQNAVAAIGKNQVGFVVPKGFIWTADLITNFRANQYYLAFGKSKDTISRNIAWTPAEVAFSAT